MKRKLGTGARIGITGSPGTGKKTIGQELAQITGLEFLSINDFAIAGKYGSWIGNEFLVDLKKTRGAIETRGKIVTGHLLPYIVPKSKIDFVAVLRCSPNVLEKRYLLRKYSKQKIKENLEAELIGVIAEKAVSTYGLGKAAEFDTSRIKNPKRVAMKILETAIGARERRFGEIDWMARLTSYRRFPEALQK